MVCPSAKNLYKGILNPNQVSINFVSRSENGNSEVHHLPVNKQGGFEKSWPGGFTERMEGSYIVMPFLTYSIKSEFVENYETVKNKDIIKFLNYIDS